MAINNDCFFRIPAILSAEIHQNHQPDTYMYLFTWESPAFDGRLGACHALEIPFIFGTYSTSGMTELAGIGSAVENLSNQMMDAWVAIARSGNPNHQGIPDWQPYDNQSRATMFFGRETFVENKPFESTRAVWDDIIK